MLQVFCVLIKDTFEHFSRPVACTCPRVELDKVYIYRSYDQKSKVSLSNMCPVRTSGGKAPRFMF